VSLGGGRQAAACAAPCAWRSRGAACGRARARPRGAPHVAQAWSGMRARAGPASRAAQARGGVRAQAGGSRTSRPRGDVARGAGATRWNAAARVRRRRCRRDRPARDVEVACRVTSRSRAEVSDPLSDGASGSPSDGGAVVPPRRRVRGAGSGSSGGSFDTAGARAGWARVVCARRCGDRRCCGDLACRRAVRGVRTAGAACGGGAGGAAFGGKLPGWNSWRCSLHHCRTSRSSSCTVSRSMVGARPMATGAPPPASDWSTPRSASVSCHCCSCSSRDSGFCCAIHSRTERSSSWTVPRSIVGAPPPASDWSTPRSASVSGHCCSCSSRDSGFCSLNQRAASRYSRMTGDSSAGSTARAWSLSRFCSLCQRAASAISSKADWRSNRGLPGWGSTAAMVKHGGGPRQPVPMRAGAGNGCPVRC
jgi:hypothetical protein